MKRYKLLKDLPFAKAGDIFKEMLDDGLRVLAPEEWGEQRHEIYLNDIYNFDEWFEDIDEDEMLNPHLTDKEFQDFIAYQKKEWSKIKDLDKKLDELS